jgi:mono/diheme cytochrome c family protein
VLIASLTTGHKLGLGLIAGAFIVFALVVSMVIPRYRPNFPSERGFKPFLAVAFCLFLATLLAVEVFGVEPKEAAGKVPVTVPKIRATRGPIAPSAADVARGKTLYTSLGCIGCHSLDGTAGTGPTWKGLAGSQVALTNGKTVAADGAYLAKSIDDPDADIVKGFQSGIMSAVIKKGATSPADVKALVAFIQSQK